MNRTALYIAIPEPEFRREMKRAALDRDTTVKALALEILSDWLTGQGYLARRATSTQEAAHA